MDEPSANSPAMPPFGLDLVPDPWVRGISGTLVEIATMAPARIRKILYPLSMVVVLLLSTALLMKFRSQPWAPWVLIAVLLIPGRVQGYFYRDFFRGRREMAAGQVDLAVEHFSRFADQVRHRPWLKGLIWLGFGVYTTDIEAMTYNNLGACHLRNGDVSGARRALYQALELSPTYPMPYFNLGLVYLLQRDRRQSAKCFQESKRLGFEAGRLDRTLSSMGQTLADIEGHPSLAGPVPPLAEPQKTAGGVLTACASAYDWAGLFDTAARRYRDARSEGPLAARLLCQLQMRLGKLDEAEATLRELASEEPASSSLRGVLWAMRGDYVKAIQCQERALERDPNHADLRANLAETLLYAERLADARETALRALARDETCAVAHAVLAQLEVRDKEWAAAELSANKALAKEESGLALEARAYSLLETGRHEEAAVALEAFLELVELARPLECNLELRTARARAELAKLR